MFLLAKSFFAERYIALILYSRHLIDVLVFVHGPHLLDASTAHGIGSLVTTRVRINIGAGA